MVKGKSGATARVKFKVVDKDGNVKYRGQSEMPMNQKQNPKKEDK